MTRDTPEAALDVRRVVKAIENVAARHGLKKEPSAPLARIYGYSTTIPDMDAQIAAEYAALASSAHRCNCPESGTSGSCPFHDSSTVSPSEP
jgi:hypothetical protein